MMVWPDDEYQERIDALNSLIDTELEDDDAELEDDDAELEDDEE